MSNNFNPETSLPELYGITPQSPIPGSELIQAKFNDQAIVVRITIVDNPDSIQKALTACANSSFWTTNDIAIQLGILAPRVISIVTIPQNLEVKAVVTIYEPLRGSDLFTKLREGSISDLELGLMADFLIKMEEIPQNLAPNSLAKAAITEEEWEKMFNENAQKFGELAIKNSSYNPELKSLIESLQSKASEFNTESVGFGGGHLRPRLGNFATNEDGVLEVTNFEAATSHYISLYGIISMFTYLLVWNNSLNGLEVATQLAQKVKDRLASYPNLQERFYNFGEIIFSQRVIGDLSDVIGKDVTSDGVNVSETGKLVGDINKFLEVFKN